MSVVGLAVMLAALLVLIAASIQPSAAEAAGNQARKCGGGTVTLNSAEFKTFQLHNQVRKNNGVRQLCVHPKLVKSARAHSRDMINRNYFSHTTQGSGRSAGDRISATGYNWRTYGENIAWGSGTRGTPQSIHNSWMNSSGHRQNMLNGAFHEVGIGAVTGNFQGNSNATMYTVNFGTR